MGSGVQNPIRDTILADLFWAKNVFIYIFGIRPCSGGVNLENWIFDHLNFEKYEPGHLYVGPFSAKIFLKIRVCKIDPSVKEGCGKGSLFAFLEAARAVVGSICRIGQVLARQRVMFVSSKEGRGAFVAHTAPQTLASLSTAHSSSPEFHLCLNMLSASSVRWVDEREEAQLASCTKAAQACGRSTQFAREQAATREWLVG